MQRQFSVSDLAFDRHNLSSKQTSINDSNPSVSVLKDETKQGRIHETVTPTGYFTSDVF